MENIEERIVTCENRFLGKCKNCQPDYDTSHHPNNYDCPFYKEMKLETFNVIPDKKYSEYKQE